MMIRVGKAGCMMGDGGRAVAWLALCLCVH